MFVLFNVAVINKVKRFFIVFIIMLYGTCLLAQSLQSDIDLLDYQRLDQISDSSNSNHFSFAKRSSSIFWLNQLSKKTKPHFTLLQASYQQQYNSSLAISANDGSFFPAVGAQHRFSVGVLFQYKNLSILLQPEMVQAVNTAPEPFNGNPTDNNFISRYFMYQLNKLDNLSQFGLNPISQFFPGQSSIRYNTKLLSMGISTENTWWGPARKNSLVLTNNAPGFLHATIQSIKPIDTRWGKLEFELIYGSLQNSPNEPEDNKIMRTIWAGGIANKSNSERRIAGYFLSFSPKGLHNLFFGATGASYFYTDSTNIQSADIVKSYENKQATANLGALFMRYKMPKELAEIYAEYGRANRFANPINVFGDTIPTGYTIGFRKGFASANTMGRGVFSGGTFWLSAELTQLQLPDARLIFDSTAIYSTPKTNSWYTHPYITQGYSNWGQVMGASIGPGSNSVHIEFAWIKGLKKIGIAADRIAFNNDFAIYNYLSGTLGNGYADRYYTHLNLALNLQWNLGNWLLSGSYQYTSALNYRWVKLSNVFSQPAPDSDRNNARAQISLIYFFKRPNFIR